MDEEKVLLCIRSLGDDTACQVHIHSENEMFKVAVVLADFIHNNKPFGFAFALALKFIENSPDTSELFTSNVVNVPDFNKLLKDLDHE